MSVARVFIKQDMMTIDCIVYIYIISAKMAFINVHVIWSNQHQAYHKGVMQRMHFVYYTVEYCWKTDQFLVYPMWRWYWITPIYCLAILYGYMPSITSSYSAILSRVSWQRLFKPQIFIGWRKAMHHVDKSCRVCILFSSSYTYNSIHLSNKWLYFIQ